MRTGRIALTGIAVVLAGAVCSAQIADQIIVYAVKGGRFTHQFARYDRKLGLLGITQVTTTEGTQLYPDWGMVVDGQGRYWMSSLDTTGHEHILRFGPDGNPILPQLTIADVALALTPTILGTVIAVTTQTHTNAAGPTWAFSEAGVPVWVTYIEHSYFWHIVTMPGGEIFQAGTYLAQIDPASGTTLHRKLFPTFFNLAASPDGALWAYFRGQLTRIEDMQIVQQAPYLETYWKPMRVDAAGNVLSPMSTDVHDPMGIHDRVVRIHGSTLQIVDDWKLGSPMTGFALGPSGEDLYATVYKFLPSTEIELRLLRLNLITGVHSSVKLPSWGVNWDVPEGDPTGFIWANVIDQAGDADGDGASNRDEVMAGSDPYDSSSRPAGPKIYLSFAPTNHAIVLKLMDPDGLYDPAAGLDFSSISVRASGYGEILGSLLPYLTSTKYSPDGQSVTATFGALPVPLDLKVALEATVKDQTGATAWDWQVTPPGNL